jgi:hypothetical protein
MTNPAISLGGSIPMQSISRAFATALTAGKRI